MKAALFLTVRTGSTRLRTKALLNLDDETIIEFMIRHLKHAHVSENFVVCTTERPEDDILEQLARRAKIDCFRGSSEDILARLNGAAVKFRVDFIVNVEGDDVFCDPGYADRTLDHFLRTDADFIHWSGLPLGASPLGIKAEALAKVCSLKETTNTETGWGSFFTQTGLFKVETIEEKDPTLNRPEIRMTMDYPQDYEFVRAVYRKLRRDDFSLRDIMSVLEANPEIADINAGLQEEYYRKFDEKRAKVRMRQPGKIGE
jgi:spore coat polysaccharide biosynthesis protein SpsF